MRWKDKLFSELLSILDKEDNVVARMTIQKILQGKVTIHLAIFSEPFLTYLLDGVKTMESRLSIKNVAPFRKITEEDLVIVKKSGAGVCAIFQVEKVQYYSNLNLEKIENLNKVFGKQLCWERDSEFLNLKSNAKYLTLISAGPILRVREFSTSKADRSGWVVLRRGLKNSLFDNEKN